MRPGSKALQKFNGWAIDSQLDRSAGVEAQLADLIRRAQGIADALTKLRSNGDLESARIWIHLDSPERGFFIDPDDLRAIAGLGSLEVDIYS